MGEGAEIHSVPLVMDRTSEKTQDHACVCVCVCVCLIIFFIRLQKHTVLKARHFGGSAFCNVNRLGVPEQALSGIPIDFGIVMEDKPSELS